MRILRKSNRICSFRSFCHDIFTMGFNSFSIPNVTIVANRKARVREQEETNICLILSLYSSSRQVKQKKNRNQPTTTMAGDAELNIDSIIARLLEGKDSAILVLHSICSCCCSTRMSTGKNCSDDRRRSTRIMFKIT